MHVGFFQDAIADGFPERRILGTGWLVGWFGGWVVWFGLVWFGLVWFVLVCFGLVWFGLVGLLVGRSVGRQPAIRPPIETRPGSSRDSLESTV